MNVLNAIETAVGSEYFNDCEHAELGLVVREGEGYQSLSIQQSCQPDSNTIVAIKQ